jgi:hypothetical protein
MECRLKPRKRSRTIGTRVQIVSRPNGDDDLQVVNSAVRTKGIWTSPTGGESRARVS